MAPAIRLDLMEVKPDAASSLANLDLAQDAASLVMLTEPTRPREASRYLPISHLTGEPAEQAGSGGATSAFQTFRQGVYDFRETVRDGVRYRTWGDYPANAILSDESGNSLLRVAYNVTGVAPAGASEGTTQYDQIALQERLQQMVSNRGELDEIRALGRVVNPHSPWLRVPDMGQVLKGAALFTGTATAGALTGSWAFGAVRSAGGGLVRSGATAGIAGDLATQGLNYRVGQATDGRYGQVEIDMTRVAASGVLGAVPGVVLSGLGAARVLRQTLIEVVPAGARVVERNAAVTGVGGRSEPLWAACFLPGTAVHTKLGAKAIERVEPGDLVAARNQFSGETRWRPVVQVFASGDKEVIHVQIEHSDGKHETVSATTQHPFFVAGRGWRGANQLNPGDRLELLDGGQSSVVAITADDAGAHVVYNFEVADDHTYFVGERGIWVHNTSSVRDALLEVQAARLPSQAGSPAHKITAWQAYQDRGGTWAYNRWEATYDLNMTRATNANAAAADYHAKLGWGKREVTLDAIIDGHVFARRLDVADVARLRGVEYKTGYQTATKDNLWELQRDSALVELGGWRIEWVFRDNVSQPLLDAIQKAGVAFRKL